MLLRNKDSEETYHVPSGVGKALISAGLAEEVIPVIPTKPKLPLVWSVRDGARVDDYQFPPVLFHSCPECGIRGMTESAAGTAHKTTKLYHCGLRAVMCPPDIAAQYERAYAAWYSRSGAAIRAAKAKAAASKEENAGPGFDPKNSNHVSPVHHVRAFGLKSRDELIVAATTAVRTGR